MKKIALAVAVILFAVILGIFLIRERRPQTDITAKTTRVGVILNGEKLDGSFCQSHYEALERIRDELNLKIYYCENTPDGEECDKIIDDLIKKKRCTILIGISEEFGSHLAKAAIDYPEISFFQLKSEEAEKMNNLSTFFGRMYQVRYLSGIVAGIKSKTGEIGYVAAMPVSEVNRGINAFTKGVRSVRSDAVVHVKFCGSWKGDEVANEAVCSLLDNYPIDVLTLHVDSSMPLIEAEKRGVWSIGYNINRQNDFPKTYLTSCEWIWDVYYRKQILNILQDKFHGSNDLIPIEEGIARLSEMTEHVSPGTEKILEKSRKRLESRTFDVFYGPVFDNKGNLRIGVGESMSDKEMLNSFNWYVEGVQVEE